MNQHNNWMPQISMPPLGFGVVMPQPGGAAPLLPTYGVANHISQGQAQINNSEGTSQYHFQQYGVGQQHQQQQQEWLKAQQKAVQDQKLLYEKMLKQKQFDEQKQRLKEFSSRSKKSTVSADAMIQNIFDKQEQSSKTRITKTCAGTSQSSLENNISDANNFYVNQTALSDPKSSHVLGSIPHSQPSYKNLNYVDINSSRNNFKDVSSPETIDPMSALSPNSVMPDMFSSTAGPLGCQTSQRPLGNSSAAVATPVQQRNTEVKSTHSVRGKEPFVHDQKVVSLKLPQWLIDATKIPELYIKASGLVQLSDGEWVDTSRAYMLLMQTNVPPHFLGVLWEMVNKTQPGRLKVSEFHGLLALVACVQNGNNFINAEVLAKLEVPVYPTINHPILLPLAQKHQQQPPSDAVSSIEPFQSESCGEVASSGPSGPSGICSAETFSDGDDFDDFVCAAVVPPVIENIPSVDDNLAPSLSLPPPPKVTQHQLHQKGNIECNKSNPVKNLPTLGNSPLNHPKEVISTDFADDEFDDFQSAPSHNSDPCDLASISSSVSTTQPNLQESFNNEDKYAVFRDLFEVTSAEPNMVNNQESSNCPTVPQSIEDRPLPQEGFSNIKPTSYLSSHVTEFDNSDPFGEFVSKPSHPNLVEGSSESSTYVTANASADTSNDDDEFGDFIGPSEPVERNCFVKSVLNIPEVKSETQSVASLELPGLDLTVNLSQNEYMVNSTPRSDLVSSESNYSSNNKTNWLVSENDLDEQFETLRLDQGGEKDNEESSINESMPIREEVAAISSEFTLCDKYDAIREFGPKIDPRIDTWERSLRGCHKLLEEGVTIATNLLKDSSLIKHALTIPQMKDYISNLEEVWKVGSRISRSNEIFELNPVVRGLCGTVDQLWHTFCSELGREADKSELEVKLCGKGSKACCICLVAEREVSLAYGGQHYHPQCANLWLNVVDRTLPSNRPVINNARPTLL